MLKDSWKEERRSILQKKWIHSYEIDKRFKISPRALENVEKKFNVFIIKRI